MGTLVLTFADSRTSVRIMTNGNGTQLTVVAGNQKLEEARKRWGVAVVVTNPNPVRRPAPHNPPAAPAMAMRRAA
jgi:hypothetical protein